MTGIELGAPGRGRVRDLEHFHSTARIACMNRLESKIFHEPRARGESMNDFRMILVPFDFSDHAREALERALDFAKRFDGAVQLLHVVAPPVLATPSLDPILMDFSGIRDSLFASLRELAEATEKRSSISIVARVVGGSNIADAIRATAEEISADLIVMGTHGRTGLAHLLVGSVTERTLRCAPCSVFTVRASASGSSASDDEVPESASACLETTTEAIARLEHAGYRESFQARAGMLYALKTQRAYKPEDLVVREVFRFEGESDPADSTVLFALRTRDEAVRGTFIAGYGVSADADSAAVVSKLQARHSQETRARELA